ncbi:MAG: phage terminase small subunit [Syntrophomonas sp.]
MSRPRSDNRDEAFRLFKESGGKLSSSAIANLLGEKLNNIKTWRVKDKWKVKVGKVGAPYENQNAVGNNGGAPKYNQNHFIHGFYSKYLPKQTLEIMKDIEGMDPLDMLWNNILMKFASIIRSQKIMFVKNKDDTTEHLKKIKTQKAVRAVGNPEDGDGEFRTYETYREEEYELQFAWDKQATFLNAQSRAMAQLTNMIKRYEEMLHKNWEMASEEQKLRVERLKVQIQNPVLKHQIDQAKQKRQLERERFEHQKKMDEMKNF